MVEHRVGLAAGEFYGACWRRHKRASTIDRAFASTPLLLFSDLSPLWGPGEVPGVWMDCCGFITPLCTNKE